MDQQPHIGGDHEALLGAVVNAMPEPFFVIDRDGRYVAVLGSHENPRYHDGRVLVGKRMHDVMPIAQADRFLAVLREALDTRQVVTFEYELGADDIEGVQERPGLPTRLWFEGHVSPLEPAEGRPDLVVWVIFDITELKRANERLEAQQLELQRLASTDPLTGLLNRRSFFDAARRELAWTRRTGRPAALVLLDLDRFKAINDTWGHAAGDTVLEAVAELLGRGRRTTDVVGRIGGEEMALVLRETDLDTASSLAERLRVELSALVVEHEGATLEVTGSFGVTTVDPGDERFEVALRRADLALYSAKREGRNAVAVSSA